MTFLVILPPYIVLVASIGVIADVHGDINALEDALEQIDRHSCARVVCCGDLVGYGVFNEEVIKLISEHGTPCCRGNHDRWAVGRGRPEEPAEDRDEALFNAMGLDLSRGSLRFLAELPFGLDLVIEGVRIAVRHGTPASLMDGIDPTVVTETDLRRWLEDVEADVLVVGHTHIPFAIQVPGGGLIANPGALYRRPEGKKAVRPWIYDSEQETFVPGATHGEGTFGILELPSMRFTVHDARDGHEVEIVRELD